MRCNHLLLPPFLLTVLVFLLSSIRPMAFDGRREAKEKPFDINSWKPDSVASIGRMIQVNATFPKPVGRVDVRISQLRPCHNLFGVGKQKSDCLVQTAGEEDQFAERLMQDTALQNKVASQPLLIIRNRNHLEITTILDSFGPKDSTVSIVFAIGGAEKEYLHKIVKSDKDSSFNELIDFTSEFIKGSMFPDSLKKN